MLGLAQRFLFVTGKGGTGKTTVSAALARARARQGKRVLLVSSGESERLSFVFGARPLTPDVTLIEPRIWGVHVDPEKAWREYAELILRSRALQTAVFRNRYANEFLRGIPGLSEWAVLGKAWYHTTESQADGQWRYDVVIVDAPATGHGLEMLRVPKVIVDLAAPGVLRRDAERAWTALSDPKQAGIVVVTLAEEMPTLEACELVAELRDELRLTIALLVTNSVAPLLFSDTERRELLACAQADAHTAGEQALRAAQRQARLESSQLDAQRRLLALDLPRVELPQLSELTGAGLERLAACFT